MDGGRVVVGVDGSPCSARALAWAADDARTHGSPLHVLTTYTMPTAPVGAAYPGPQWVSDQAWAHEGEIRAAARETQARVIQENLGEDPGVPVSTEVLEGSAAARLIEASKDARLLVVGSRGHGGFTGMLLGSVSHHVVPHAGCTVVVVR